MTHEQLARTLAKAISARWPSLSARPPGVRCDLLTRICAEVLKSGSGNWSQSLPQIPPDIIEQAREQVRRHIEQGTPPPDARPPAPINPPPRDPRKPWEPWETNEGGET